MLVPNTVVIAGFGPGLGTALQERFTHGGYTVIGVSRNSGSPWSTDLRDPGATAELFTRIDREAPPMAGVIHNAMQFLRAPFLSLRPEDFESVWKSIVLTAVNTSHQAVPRLIARGGGSLIFSGASGSRRAGAQFSAFSSAKFALRGLCQSLAREHGTDGIHVSHVVIDGLIDSERTRERFGEASGTPRIAAAALADLYWQLFHQPANAWTHEIDVRPADVAP